MSKTAWSAVLVLACAAPAAAQESLLPTYVNSTGEVTAEAILRYIAGQGTLANPAFEIDFENSSFFGEVRAAVGIGGRFEIEASFPYQFDGTGEADESGVEFEVETAGIGDLTLEGNYVITPASKDSPQVVAGLVLVVPVGDDDFGVPEVRIGGVQIQDGEDGGLGQGVFKIGLGVAVGKQVTGAYVYGGARFLVPLGKQDGDDVEVDRPDTFTLLGGAMLGLGERSNLDLRLIFNYLGDEVAEDDAGGEETEEAHINLTLEPRFYFSVGSMATIIVGGTLGWEQDHAIDEESDLDLEDVFVYGLSLGLHLRLGASDDDK